MYLQPFPVYSTHEGYGPFAQTAIVDVSEPFLTTGQAYDVSLELHLPESSVNEALGNVMILMELKNYANKTIVSESRPVTK